MRRALEIAGLNGPETANPFCLRGGTVHKRKKGFPRITPGSRATRRMLNRNARVGPSIRVADNTDGIQRKQWKGGGPAAYYWHQFLRVPAACYPSAIGYAP